MIKTTELPTISLPMKESTSNVGSVSSKIPESSCKKVLDKDEAKNYDKKATFILNRLDTSNYKSLSKEICEKGDQFTTFQEIILRMRSLDLKTCNDKEIGIYMRLLKRLRIPDVDLFEAAKTDDRLYAFYYYYEIIGKPLFLKKLRNGSINLMSTMYDYRNYMLLKANVIGKALFSTDILQKMLEKEEPGRNRWVLNEIIKWVEDFKPSIKPVEKDDVPS